MSLTHPSPYPESQLESNLENNNNNNKTQKLLHVSCRIEHSELAMWPQREPAKQ